MIGAHLGLHRFQAYRSANKRKPDATAKLAKGVSSEQSVEWAHGSSLADSQNFARVLMEVTIADLFACANSTVLNVQFPFTTDRLQLI